MASGTKSTGVTPRARRTLRAVRQHKWTGLCVNAAPSAIWLGVFFLLPLLVMLYYSFGQRGAFGEVLVGVEHLGLQQYRKFLIPDDASLLGAVWITVAWVAETLVPVDLGLSAAEPTPYVQLTLESVFFGAVATLVSFVIGYPMAYFLGRVAPARYQNLLLVLVILPFWASFLVRIYAIQLILTADNFLNAAIARFVDLLAITPWIDGGGSLMNSQFAVLLGLVYIWIPFMILPVYASIEEIDFTLQEAALDLGADRYEAFRHVIFPLSKPGVAAGSILVFIPSTGAYVIPELLGGPSSQMIGNFIANQFGAAGNWPMGAAASFVLMAVMMAAIGAYQRYAGGELL